MNKKIGLVSAVVGCLLVCVLVFGSLSRANNDSLTVNGGEVTINNGQEQALGAYIDSNQVTTFTDVNIDNDLVVDGALTVTGDLSISSATLTGELQAQNVVTAGTVTSIATSGAESLSAAQICDSGIIRVSLSKAASNITLPASSTLAADCFGSVGKTKTIIYQNISTVAASSTTIIAGGGMDIQSDDANGDVIAGLDSAKLTISRVAADGASEFLVQIEPFTPAD